MGARIGTNELDIDVDVDLIAGARLGGDERCTLPENACVRIDIPTMDNAPRDPSVMDDGKEFTSSYANTYSTRSVGRLKQIAQSVLTRNRYVRSRLVDLLLFARTNKTLIMIIMILL